VVAQSGIKKYLKPAQITELDWIIMKVNIVVSDIIPIDSYGLIQHASYQALPRIEKVAISFMVDKDIYFKLGNHTISKVFVDVIEQLFDVLNVLAPEINLKNDVVAYFSFDATKKIASFENGKLKFEEKRF
jgi:hypothetical protein